MKKLPVLLFSILFSLCLSAQVYQPNLHVTVNKSIGQAAAAPTDARSEFYDQSLFIYRPYQSLAEVRTYLSLAKYRVGGFDILVNVGGTLNLDGTFTGGTTETYFFKNGTADGDLVLKVSSAIYDSTSVANQLATKPTLTTIAGLRAMTAPSATAIYYTTDYPGNWKWNAASTATDNTGLIVKATSVTTGRFERIYQGPVNLQWFTGPTDGTTDYTTQVHTMMTAINKTGPVVIPLGTFVAKWSETGVNGLTIIGSGPGSVLKLPNSANATLLKFPSSSNVIIQNIALDGNKANNPTNETPDAGENNRNDNIYFSKGTNYYVTNCYIHDARGNGVNAYKPVNIHVDYNEIAFCNAADNDQNLITYQFAATNEATAKDNGGTVTGNYLHDNATGFAYSSFTAHGIHVSDNTIKNCRVGLGAEIGGSYNTFLDNIIDSVDVAYVVTGNVTDTSRHAFGNSIEGGSARHIRGGSTGFIQVGSAWGLRISNLTLEGTGAVAGPGIGLIQSNDVTINKVDISGATQSGVLSTIVSGIGCLRLTVTESKIHGNGEDGALLLGVPRLMFNNNRVYNNIRHGLQVQSSDRITYKNNFIYDDQTIATQQYAVVLTSCNGIVGQNNTYSFNQFTPDVNLIGTANSNYITSGDRNISRALRSSVPVSGAWAKGDIVYDSSYASGAPMYYVCIVGGIPGTWVSGPRYNLDSIMALKAPLASPALTGVPTVPTAAPGTNTTQAASTAFVAAAVIAGATGVASFNSRTGAVVPATGDYTAAQVTGAAAITSQAFLGTPTFGTTAFDVTNSRLGIGTVVPTHALTLATGSQAVLYNTSDQTTNYERLRMLWSSGLFSMVTENGGTGAARNIRLSAANSPIDIGVVTGTKSAGYRFDRNSTAIQTFFNLTSSNTGWTASNIVQEGMLIDPTITQTSTAGYAVLKISPFESSLGSGAHWLIDAGTAATYVGTHTQVWGVDNKGHQFSSATNTAIGTTGNQTINKPSGIINIAAAGTSVVLTNSLITTSSLVFTQIGSNDATAKSTQVVTASGSCTIFLNAASTGTVPIYFWVIN